jgi:hypothetical protein
MDGRSIEKHDTNSIPFRCRYWVRFAAARCRDHSSKPQRIPTFRGLDPIAVPLRPDTFANPRESTPKLGLIGRNALRNLGSSRKNGERKLGSIGRDDGSENRVRLAIRKEPREERNQGIIELPKNKAHRGPQITS